MPGTGIMLMLLQHPGEPRRPPGPPPAFTWTRNSRWTQTAATYNFTAFRVTTATQPRGPGKANRTVQHAPKSSLVRAARKSRARAFLPALLLHFRLRSSLRPDSQLCWEERPSWNQASTSTHCDPPAQAGFQGLLLVRVKLWLWDIMSRERRACDTATTSPTIH